MPLITLKQGLEYAEAGKYALGSFNVTNHTFVEGVLSAAELKECTVVLSIAERHLPLLDASTFLPYVLQRIKGSSVPVVLHLDHATNRETIIKAIKFGFSSVMIDCSSCPYDENLNRTASIVQLAHNAGVSVEAELGCVGGDEGSSRIGTADTLLFTKPEEAVSFAEETGVDALAVAIGTVHGQYKGKPRLDLHRLQVIHSLTAVPLVLHGGSGLGADRIQKAIRKGIRKVNVFTENSMAAKQAILDCLDRDPLAGFPIMLGAAEQAIREKTLEFIGVFQISGLS